MIEKGHAGAVTRNAWVRQEPRSAIQYRADRVLQRSPAVRLSHDREGLPVGRPARPVDVFEYLARGGATGKLGTSERTDVDPGLERPGLERQGHLAARRQAEQLGRDSKRSWFRASNPLDEEFGWTALPNR